MIEQRDKYKTRVVGYGPRLNKIRTPDGVLHIDVRDVPNCTWELEDTSFYCTHDEFEVVDYVEDHQGSTATIKLNTRATSVPILTAKSL